MPAGIQVSNINISIITLRFPIIIKSSRMAWFDNFVGDYISEGYSLMAIDSDSGQMVGLAIFTKCKSKINCVIK